MSEPIIKVENISKRYALGEKQPYYSLRDSISDIFKKRKPKEEFWALKDINFEVAQGETVGIIGRNGAGKSTLLKILSRITPPTSGKITMHGRVASLLEVGTGFSPELTGRENIYLNGAILGMSKKEINRKFDEIVAFSEIEKFLDTPVKRYSSGMYVRLAFAVAAHLEPEILIVDEVLAVGDANFQKKCLGKMGEVAKGGRTVLFVSHNMAAVKSLCRKAVILDGGDKVFEGSTGEAIEKYLEINDNLVQKNLSQDGFIIFNERENQRNKEKFIKGIRLLNKGKESQTFLMGEGMDIELLLENLPSNKAHFGIMIKNAENQVVTALNELMIKTIYADSRSNCEKATIRIPTLQFSPGKYSIDISVARKGAGRLDFIENGVNFLIEENDIYDTGYRFTSYFGSFFIQDPKISIEEYRQNE